MNLYGIKNNSNLCGSFELYLKEVLFFLGINLNEIKNLEKNNLSHYSEINLQVQKLLKEFNFSLEALKKKYEEILISDEIDDYKIFENFFIDAKLKNTPIKNNTNFNLAVKLNLSNSSVATPNNFISSHSTANTQKSSNPFYKSSLDSSPIGIDLGVSQSPYNNLKFFQANEKLSFEQFFEELRTYQYLDIHYLYKKFSKFNIHNNTYTYSKFYENFNFLFAEQLILPLTPQGKEDFKSAIANKTNHKNLYVKLVEELFTQERSKFKLQGDGFNLLLNDPSFHNNFLLISFFVYINLLFLEKPQLLQKIIVAYFEHLHTFIYFDFINIFKILTNLSKINLPFNIKNIIKKFQNSLINYTLWQDNSILYKILEDEEKGTLEDEEYLRNIRVNFLK
jgi:hypothetical protein